MLLAFDVPSLKLSMHRLVVSCVPLCVRVCLWVGQAGGPVIELATEALA